MSEATREHLRGMERDGVRAWLNAAEARLPKDLAALVRNWRQGLRPWLTEAGIHGAADLRALLDEQRHFAQAWSTPDEPVTTMREHQPRVNIGRALAALEPLIAQLAAGREELRIHPVGSVRRFEPTVGDLLVLLAGPGAAEAIAVAMADVPESDVLARTADAVTLLVEREEVTLRCVDMARLGCALLHYSGSRAHVQQLQARAAERGFVLTAHRFAQADGRMLPAESEAVIYEALGLPWIPAERRHGLDEIAVAEREGMPATVALDDIRGDLHLHTLWSDGRDTTEGMIFAARALGYAYVAITDHSPSAHASRVLTLERLDEQSREIAALRTKHPSLEILHGCEVDILPDGTLDLPDATMEGLDIVLASLHDPHGHDGARLTDRYIQAMQHPCVNVITHPANRVPGRSEGYALDWDRFFAAARETGTAIEVDGAPGHIDLDGHVARAAVEAGCTLCIDSDGHFADRIGRQMRIGVGTAARGGVRPGQVLNTRDVAGVRAFIAAKRGR